MKELTVDLIRDNPWNAVNLKLPKDANKVLLRSVYLAAVYCADSEYFLLGADRRGEYMPYSDVPPEFDYENPNLNPEMEQRWHKALCRREQAAAIYEERFKELMPLK